MFERFYPGYFNATRPVITNAPAQAAHGAAIVIDSPQAASIGTVVLMRSGAVTHGFNMAQRAIECEITGGDAATVTVDLPANQNVAPRGWYLLFVVDGFRIPSEGRWFRLS